MKGKTMVRSILWLGICMCIFTVLFASATSRLEGKISEELAKYLAKASPTEMVEVSIILRDQSSFLPDISVSNEEERMFASTVQMEYNRASQKEIIRLIEQLNGFVHTQFWLVNDLVAVVPASAVLLIARHPDVLLVSETWCDDPPPMGDVVQASWTNAIGLWNTGATGLGVKVGVFDTGINENIAPLQGKVVWEKNYTNSPNTNDVYNHGTSCAAIIAGREVSGTGHKKGMAPDAVLYNFKVYNDNGYTSSTWFKNAAQDAYLVGIHIASMSYGDALPRNQVVVVISYKLLTDLQIPNLYTLV